MTDKKLQQIECDRQSLEQDRLNIIGKQKCIVKELLQAFKEKYNTNVIYFDTEFDCLSAVYFCDCDCECDVCDINISSININDFTFSGNAPRVGIDFEDLDLAIDPFNFDWDALAERIIHQLKTSAFEPGGVDAKETEQMPEKDVQELRELVRLKQQMMKPQEGNE